MAIEESGGGLQTLLLGFSHDPRMLGSATERHQRTYNIVPAPVCIPHARGADLFSSSGVHSTLTAQDSCAKTVRPIELWPKKKIVDRLTLGIASDYGAIATPARKIECRYVLAIGTFSAQAVTTFLAMTV